MSRGIRHRILSEIGAAFRAAITDRAWSRTRNSCQDALSRLKNSPAIPLKSHFPEKFFLEFQGIRNITKALLATFQRG